MLLVVVVVSIVIVAVSARSRVYARACVSNRAIKAACAHADAYANAKERGA